MPSQRQSFFNSTSRPLEVMVEPTPDRYLLPIHAEMVIEAEYDGQDPFTVYVHDDGLQIYPGIWPLNVWINGEEAKPDWKSPGPNAVKRMSAHGDNTPSRVECDQRHELSAPAIQLI